MILKVIQMKLAEYLVLKSITQAECSRQLGISQVAVHQYIYKKALPSGKMMVRIYKWSNGRVNLKDWAEDFWDKVKP
tara:strand:+ start:899 stop:1129 length:231 start_codon:yes stop_codon:yes gene_type:complete